MTLILKDDITNSQVVLSNAFTFIVLFHKRSSQYSKAALFNYRYVIHFFSVWDGSGSFGSAADELSD